MERLPFIRAEINPTNVTGMSGGLGFQARSLPQAFTQGPARWRRGAYSLGAASPPPASALGNCQPRWALGTDFTPSGPAWNILNLAGSAPS